MRRRTTLLFVLVLGLVAALGITPGLIAAQETQIQGKCPSNPPESKCEGLSFKSLPGGVDVKGGWLQPYSFAFLQQWAAIPKARYPEPMLVYVQSGEFCFGVGDKDSVNGPVVVHPPVDNQGRGAPIQIMQFVNIGTPSAEPYCVPDDSGAPCANAGTPSAGPYCVPDGSGAACTEACTIDPNTTVLLTAGSVVSFPGGVCVWCLLNSLSAGEKAHLLVYALIPDKNNPGSFSWTQLGFDVATVASPVPASPAAQGLHMIRGWAMNPGGACDR